MLTACRCYVFFLYQMYMRLTQYFCCALLFSVVVETATESKEEEDSASLTASAANSSLFIGPSKKPDVSAVSPAAFSVSLSSYGPVGPGPDSILNGNQTDLSVVKPEGPKVKVSPGNQMLTSSRRALFVTRKKYLKKGWCKTERLRQKVRHKDCIPKTVVNKFCYGQCNSFFIPRRGHFTNNKQAFKSCSFCKPKTYKRRNVTLHCPGQTPERVTKEVKIIKKCRCQTVWKIFMSLWASLWYVFLAMEKGTYN